MNFLTPCTRSVNRLNLLNKPNYIFNSDGTQINMGQRTGKMDVARGSKQAYSEECAPRDHITAHLCFC